MTDGEPFVPETRDAGDDATQAYIRTWHGIDAPNDAGRRMAAQLDETIAGYASLRAAPPLLDQPGDFAAALIFLRDREEPCPSAP